MSLPRKFFLSDPLVCPRPPEENGEKSICSILETPPWFTQATTDGCHCTSQCLSVHQTTPGTSSSLLISSLCTPACLSVSLEETGLSHVILLSSWLLLKKHPSIWKRDACAWPSHNDTVSAKTTTNKKTEKETICGMTPLFTLHQCFLFFRLLCPLPSSCHSLMQLISSSTQLNSVNFILLCCLHDEDILSQPARCDEIKLYLKNVSAWNIPGLEKISREGGEPHLLEELTPRLTTSSAPIQRHLQVRGELKDYLSSFGD